MEEAEEVTIGERGRKSDGRGWVRRREKTGKLVDRSTSGSLPLNGNAEGIIAVSRSS